MVQTPFSSDRLGREGRWLGTGIYAAAHFGKSLFWYGGEVLFAYFLTDVAGLAPSAMALVIGLGFVMSAGVDRVLAQRLPMGLSSAQQAARLQSLGAIVCSVMLIAFLATPYVAQDWRIAFALLSGAGLRIAYSIYDLPQNALMALATADDAARNRTASARISASGLATLAVALGVGPVLAAREDGTDDALMLVLGVGVAIIAMASAWALRHLIVADGGGSVTAIIPPPAYGPKTSQRPVLRAIVPYLAIMAVMSFAPPLFSKLEPYFAVYVLSSVAWGGAIIVALALGLVIAQPLWFRLSLHRSRQPVLIVAALVQASGALIFAFSAHSPSAGLLVGALLLGCGNGGLGMALWAGFSDRVSRLGSGASGLAFSFFTATAKLALAGGILVLATLVDPLIQGTEGPAALTLAMIAGPVLGSAAVVMLVLGFDLTRNPVEKA